jgi:hypothetical protein
MKAGGGGGDTASLTPVSGSVSMCSRGPAPAAAECSVHLPTNSRSRAASAVDFVVFRTGLQYMRHYPQLLEAGGVGSVRSTTRTAARCEGCVSPSCYRRALLICLERLAPGWRRSRRCASALAVASAAHDAGSRCAVPTPFVLFMAWLHM